jgi:hypothetical protein
MENQQEIIWTTDLIIRLSFVIILVVGVIIILLLPPSKKAKERSKYWKDLD